MVFVGENTISVSIKSRVEFSQHSNVNFINMETENKEGGGGVHWCHLMHLLLRIARASSLKDISSNF